MKDEEKERPQITPDTTAKIPMRPGVEEMEAEPEKAYIRPEDVSQTEAVKILAFLNAAKTPEEIAAAVEFPGERDVGVKLAQRILAERNKLGTFRTLQEVASIRQIGTERFTEIVKAVSGMEITPKPEIEIERTQFRSLIMKNPNYFGNVKVSPFKSVKPMTKNTAYEEMKCVGFNPQFDRIETVVLLKKGYGYGGDICSSGTPEYIRFYADWNNDGNWEDLGVTQFTAYDIPGNKPLEYAVTLMIDPKKKWCGIENLPKVRAILSWNNPPPANDPSFTPVWGNVLDVRIQIDTLKLIAVGALMEMVGAKIPLALQTTVDAMQEVPLIEPKALGITELAELYKDKGVPEHRFGFAQVQKMMIKPALTADLMAPKYAGPLAELKIDVSTLLDAVLKTDGDTRFEELKCVGLNNRWDTLVGILDVKLSNGYSGNLCTKGSKEYVAFWEWDEIEQMWLYLGTASVNVHDINSIPPDGIRYAVFLPVDLTRHLQPCTAGPKLVKIRAILSWETPPPPTNPNWVPTWGNREETLVHVKPGVSVPETNHTPIIETVASMGVDDIDNTSGLASGVSAGTAGFTAQESPFGGEIRITGRILHPPDSFIGGAAELRYKVSVRRSGLGEAWQPLTNSFNIKLSTLVGGIYTGPFNHNQEVVDSVWYKYLEDYKGPDKRFLPIPLLAVWRTSGDMTGLWEIRIDAHDPNTGLDWPGSQIIKVCLDQKAPKAEISITGVSRDGGPVEPAEPCGKFQVGDVIHGEYKVEDEDEHFRVLTLGVRPGGPGWPSFGATPNPSSRSYPAVPGEGETGTWTLNTAGMAPCGYVVHLWTEDRTVVHGGSIGWGNSADVGFCLEVPPEKPPGKKPEEPPGKKPDPTAC